MKRGAFAAFPLLTREGPVVLGGRFRAGVGVVAAKPSGDRRDYNLFQRYKRPISAPKSSESDIRTERQSSRLRESSGGEEDANST